MLHVTWKHVLHVIYEAFPQFLMLSRTPQPFEIKTIWYPFSSINVSHQRV